MWSAWDVWPDKSNTVVGTDFLTAPSVSFCVWADVCVCVRDVAVILVKLLLNYLTLGGSDSPPKTVYRIQNSQSYSGVISTGGCVRRVAPAYKSGPPPPQNNTFTVSIKGYKHKQSSHLFFTNRHAHLIPLLTTAWAITGPWCHSAPCWS